MIPFWFFNVAGDGYVRIHLLSCISRMQYDGFGKGILRPLNTEDVVSRFLNEDIEG